MEVGDLIVLTESPFEDANIFGYQNGDVGLVKKVVYSDHKVFKTCLVILWNCVFVFITSKGCVTNTSHNPDILLAIILLLSASIFYL